MPSAKISEKLCETPRETGNFAQKITNMELNRKIESFVLLGEFLTEFLESKNRQEDPRYSQLEDAVELSGKKNGWFTRESVEYALSSWSELLIKDKLEKWLSSYSIQDSPDPVKNVAVIMAGNIPLVGFHDFITVLMSGHHFVGRLSSDDTELLPAIAKILMSNDLEWEGRISFTQEQLKEFDAVIATGSNNSSHYFNYYFSKVPNIIRKNRNGVAILTGKENEQELSGLADDVFLYYGLGCRNVSKLYFPEGYDVAPLFKAFERYRHFAAHHKWMNNHDYYRSIFLLNQIPSLDNGFVLMTENELIGSPPAVLYYEYYSDLDNLTSKLSLQQNEIQITVCTEEIHVYSCLPGMAQKPGLNEYADGIDSMAFCCRTL